MRTSLDIMLLLIATNNTITMQLRLLLITEITLLAAVSIGAKHAHLRQRQVEEYIDEASHEQEEHVLEAIPDAINLEPEMTTSLALSCLLGEGNDAELTITAISDSPGDETIFTKISKLDLTYYRSADMSDTKLSTDSIKFKNVLLENGVAVIPFIPLSRGTIVHLDKAQLLDTNEEKYKFSDEAEAECLLRPDLAISDIEKPTEVLVNEQVQVELTVQEIAGDVGATFDIELSNDDGDVLGMVQDLSVDHNSRLSVTLNTSFTEAGTHNLVAEIVASSPGESDLDNNIARFSIECLLRPDLTISNIEIPAEALVDEQVQVVATVQEIAGDVGATFGIILSEAGAVLGMLRDLSIDHKSQLEVTFSTSFDEIGTHYLVAEVVDIIPGESNFDNNIEHFFIEIKATPPVPYDFYYRRLVAAEQTWSNPDMLYLSGKILNSEAYNMNIGYIYEGFREWPITIQVRPEVDGVLLNPIVFEDLMPTYEDSNPATGYDFKYAYYTISDFGYNVYGWSMFTPYDEEVPVRSRFGASRYLQDVNNMTNPYPFPPAPDRDPPSSDALSTNDYLNANNTIRSYFSIKTGTGQLFASGWTQACEPDYKVNDYSRYPYYLDMRTDWEVEAIGDLVNEN